MNKFVDWGVKLSMITGDCWYSSAKNLKFLKEQKLGVVIGIVANRQVSVNKGKYQRVDSLEIEEKICNILS